MNNFWNERYSAAAYAYGEEPNRFVKDQLHHLNTGKILFPAEGEGRNAVFAAIRGWNVFAFDPSIEGRKKAERLARKKGAHIHYQLNTFDTVEYEPETFDCIALVFAHMPSQERKDHHRKLLRFLKPGGTLLLEGFSKAQINRNTGGPRQLDFLFSREDLLEDFKILGNLEVEEVEEKLEEGLYHQGEASLIRVVGKK